MEEVEETGHQAGLHLVLDVDQPAVEVVVFGQAGADGHEPSGLGRVLQDLLQLLFA